MQDLTNKLSHPYKENTAPNQVPNILRAHSRRLNNVAARNASTRGKKRMSVTDVSEMLYELYLAKNASKATKAPSPPHQPQTIPAGAATTALKYMNETSPVSVEKNDLCGPAAAAATNTALVMPSTSKLAAPFLPRTNCITAVPSPNKNFECNTPQMTAIRTSVVVPTTSANSETLDIKPNVHPTSGLIIPSTPGVIRPLPLANATANTQAAVIAAALIRDGYHNFQQQIRAQEIMKFHTGKQNFKVENTAATKIFENFLRQQQGSVSEADTAASDNNNNGEGEDEDASRCSGFDNIQLVEDTNTRPQFSNLLHTNGVIQNSAPSTPASNDYQSDESQKYMNMYIHARAQAQVLVQAQNQALAQAEAQVQALSHDQAQPLAEGQHQAQPLIKFDNLNLVDIPSTSSDNATDKKGKERGSRPPGEVFLCRVCNKNYRWKSTLRRHESVECGGKLPSHQCPYCHYKSKQRGNLGVHVRKHHANMPQLTSRRRSKYSTKVEPNSATQNLESNESNTNNSEDSSFTMSTNDTSQ